MKIVVEDVSNIGFAIPVNTVKRIVADLEDDGIIYPEAKIAEGDVAGIRQKSLNTLLNFRPNPYQSTQEFRQAIFTDLILDMDEENMDVFQTQHEMRMIMIELDLQSKREDITIGSWNENSNKLQ